MPTYEYRCRECGHELEAVQSFTDDPLAECPSCGGALRKKFAAPGIAFKGSGFYKTDSRKTAKGDGGSSTTSTSGTGKSDKEGKGDKNSGDASKTAASNGASSTSSSSSSSTPSTSSATKDA